ncbi:MAG: response regulator transcription factor [Phycisphaerales bacterium]|nr:response regulator transcription factor [Phycisphaerales bacterium]
MPANSSILIVEDELDLADLLVFHLEREGYVCRRVEDGERALAEAYRQPPNLIILDRMLPKVSGDEVAMRLKRDPRTAQIPIIMLTAKAADEDELVGFALGSDDYIRKPFSIKLLLARVAAVLRRQSAAASPKDVLTVGNVVLDHGRHEVLVGGLSLELTATEFRILATLMAARGRVLTREQLIDSAVGHGAAITNRAMDVHIAALRRKLGAAADYVHTVRGVGYAFRVPESAASEP